MQQVKAKLVIVGEGQLRKELEQKARSLGLEQQIVFLGKLSREELKYCYQVCDVFVLPSVERSEAFGIAQLEAMAYGKPVVDTNLPTGVPYVSMNGEQG
jgi:rhamnosyl/mannosyltransferase